jgi:hypothetical protein
MKKLTPYLMAFLLAAGICKPALATSYDTYTLHGNTCTTTSSVIPMRSQWGINSIQATDVICPLVPANKLYGTVGIYITGYAYSPIDLVSCTLTTTDQAGTLISSKKVELPGNVSPSLLNRTGYAYNTPGSYYYSLQCHLPAQSKYGLSYLTSAYLWFAY